MSSSDHPRSTDCGCEHGTGLDWPGRGEGLSDREWEILALITQGKSNAEVAKLTYLSNIEDATPCPEHRVSILGLHDPPEETGKAPYARGFVSWSQCSDTSRDRVCCTTTLSRVEDSPRVRTVAEYRNRRRLNRSARSSNNLNVTIFSGTIEMLTGK